MVFNQLGAYFSSDNLLFHSQYGFRADHSTELAAIELVDTITQTLDKGELPLALFLDLSKACDTLNYEILLIKLRQYGILSNQLDFFQSYLDDCRQFVDFNDTVSSTAHTPQVYHKVRS